MKTRLFVIGIIIIAALGILVIFGIRTKLPFADKGMSKKDALYCSEVLEQAARYEAEGNLPGAKSLYEKLIRDFTNSPQVGDWQKKTWDLNIRLLFSPAVTPGSTLYEIKRGDSLAKIAKKFHTTVELLKKSNGLLNDKIITGKKLKVWTSPFNIVVDKSQNILILKSDDEVIKTYIVSTGINNSTPVGNFKIINKLVNPIWFKAGAMVPPESPDNVLGSYWMGFDVVGYGIHGTTKDERFGQQVTQGCIRMSNPNVEELFTIVPVGTEVTIVD